MLDWIPKGDFPSLDAILLDNFSLIASVDKLKLDEISCTFALNDKYAEFKLIPELISISDLKISFAISDPLGSKEVKAEIDGIAKIERTSSNSDLMVKLSALQTDLEFSIELGRNSSINITELLKSLIEYPIPIETPDIECSELYINGSTKPTKFTFNSTFKSDLTIPFLFVDIKELRLYFEYEKQKKEGSVSKETIHLSGKVSFFDKIDVFLLAEVNEKGWRFEGSFTTVADESLKITDFLPQEIKIPEEIVSIRVKSGKIIIDTGKKSLDIEVQTDSHISFGELGKLENKSFSLHFEELNENSYKWEIKSQGAIKLLEIEDNGQKKPLIDIGGTLQIEGEKEQFKINFIADEGSGVIRDIPILIPYTIEDGEIDWSSMEFQVSKLEIEKKSGWHFGSDFKLKFTKIPDVIGNLLPEDGIEVRLSIDTTKGADIALKKDVLDIAIPSIKIPPVGDLPEFDLGQARITFGDLKIALNNKFASVESGVKFYLPTRLNYLFGEDQSTKQPKIIIFDTYQPDHPKESNYLGMKFFGKVTASGDLDVGFTLNQIPIAAITSETDEQKREYWAINLGSKEQSAKYGSIWIEKPEFELDFKKGGFKGKGGFIIKKDPTIPLDLLKQLLIYANQEQAAKTLPEGITIPFTNPPQFIEDGKLNVPKINEFFGNNIPGSIIDILNQIASFVNKLPNSFLEYMDLRVPAELHFDITITPDGGIDVSLTSEPGLKMLFLTPPSPLITGIVLRQFSFGEMFAGQLFKLRIDADIDIMDIEMLAGSLIMDESLYDYFGNPKEYKRRIELHKLLTIIFYQAGFPIPIPLFFDKIGIDYYGIGDITCKSSFELKEPSFNVEEIGSMLTDFVRFITDPKYHFDPKKVYEDFNLKFNIGPNYIQTGKLLGSEVYGLKDGLELPSLYEVIAYMLNGAKFFDIQDFVKAIDLKYRVGSGKYISNFVCLSMSADWMITTPQEFIAENGYSRLQLDAPQAQKFMEILPKKEDSTPITEKDKGLIIFMKGKWETAFSSMDAAFGFMAVNKNRFNTGFYLNGYVANLYYIDLIATVKINTPDVPFKLYGHDRTQLNILGLPIFTGETTLSIDKNHFRIDGTFSLLDADNLIYFRSTDNMGGKLGQNSFELSGGVEAGFLIFTGTGSLSVSSQGIDGKIRILDRETSLRFIQRGDSLEVGGSIPLGWTNYSLSAVLTPSTNSLFVNLKSETIGLISLNIIYRMTLNSSRQGARGELHLYILEFINPNPILNGHVSIYNDGFSANGHFKLLPDNSPFNLEGEIGGEINGYGFNLGGFINLSILGISAIGCKINIGISGISGSFSYLGGDYTFGVEVYNNKLYVYGKYVFLGKEHNFYIDDVFPYLHLECKPPFANQVQFVQSITDCPYRYATALLDEQYSKLVENSLINKNITVANEELLPIFENEILGLYNLSIHVYSDDEDNIKYQMITSRMTEQEDFFTELKATIQEGLAKNEMDYDLNISDAKGIFENSNKNDGVARVIIHLPHESSLELQKMEVDFDYNDPGKFYFSIISKVYKCLKNK